MDEQPQQPRNPNDLLIIQNIDNEDHEWQYDSVKTPLPYYIRTGETRKLPFYIAKHGVEKLIDKILQKQGKIHTNSIFRDELRNRIVVGLEHINLVREKTPNEIALENLQRKKDADPYEEILKAREVEAERQHAAELASMQPKAPVIQTTGTTPTIPVPTTPSVAMPNNPLATPLNGIDAPLVDPERQEVYNLLTTRLHLDLTHAPTKEKFDATPLNQLKAEFAGELPELAPVVPSPQAAPESVIPPTAPTIPPVVDAASIPTTPMQAPVIPQPSVSSPQAPILNQQLGVA